MLDEYSVYYNENVRAGVAKGYSVSQMRDFAINTATSELEKGKDAKEVYSTLENVWGIRQKDSHADITNAKALATTAFVNQKTGAEMPDTAPQREITSDTGLLETLGEGAQRSIPGLANKLIAGDRAPANLSDSATFMQKVAYGTGQFMGDYLPMMAAAKALSPLLAGGAPGVAAYGLSLAAVGFTTGATRQWLMDQLRLGKAENVDEAMTRFGAIADAHIDGGKDGTPLTGDDFVKINEFTDRLKRAGTAGLSEAFVFGSMGAAGAALKKALFANLPAVLANLTPVQQFFTLSGRGAAAFSGEMAAMTAAQGGVAGVKAVGSENYWETLKAELPTLSDVMVNAVTIGGFKAAGVTAGRMGQFYVDTGVPPNGFRTLVTNKQGFAFEALSDSWHGRTPRGRQGFRAAGDERVYFDRNEATAANDALIKERSTAMAEEQNLRNLLREKEAVPHDPESLTELRERVEAARAKRIALDSNLPESQASTPMRGVETVMVPNSRVIDVPMDSTGVSEVLVDRYIESTGQTGLPKDPIALGEWKDNLLRQPTAEFREFLKNEQWTEGEVRTLLGDKSANYDLSNVVRDENGKLDWTWRGFTYGNSFIPIRESDVLPMKIAQSVKGLSDVAKVELERLTMDMKTAAKEAGTTISDQEIINNAKILRGMALSAQQLYGVDAEVYLSKYQFTGQRTNTMGELGKTPGVYKQIYNAYKTVPWIAERMDIAAEMRANGKSELEIEKKTGYMVDKDGNAVVRDTVNMKDFDFDTVDRIQTYDKDTQGRAYAYLEDVYKNAKLYDTIPEMKDVKVRWAMSGELGKTARAEYNHGEKTIILNYNRLWGEKGYSKGQLTEDMVQQVQRAMQNAQGAPAGETGSLIKGEGKYLEYFPGKLERPNYIESPATLTSEALRDLTDQQVLKDGADVADVSSRRTGDLTAENARGYIDVRNGRRWVTLLETADSSTITHEFGHAFVADLFRQQLGGDIKATSDIAILKKATGAETYEELQHAVTDKLWEPYFMNNINAGQATGIMARMKVGLHNLYEQARGLKGGIQYDVARVFDRAVVAPSETGMEGTLKSWNSGINFAPKKPGVGKLLAESYKGWFDKLVALNKGAENGLNTESYIASRTAIASGDKAQLWMQNSTYDYHTAARNGESLQSILRDAGNLKDVSSYLTALNTVGRFNEGKPVILSVDDARRVITHFESNPALPAVAERLRMYNSRLMQYAHDAGLIKPETLAEYANQPYLPLETLAKSVEAGLISRRQLSEFMDSAHGVDAQEAAAKAVKAEEGQRKVEDPILSLAGSTVAIMEAVDKNNALRAIAKDWGFSEATPVEGDPQYATVKGKSDRLKKISFLDEGKSRTTYVQKDIYDAAKGLEPEARSMFTDVAKFLLLPTKLVRAGAVLDPGFILRNLGRDQLTAGIQSQVGYRVGTDMLRGMGAILNHKTGGKLFGRFDEIYEKWVNAGGGSASQISGDKNILDSTLTEMLSLKPINLVRDPKRYARGLMHVLNPLTGLREVSESIEVSTRLGEFMRAREQGYTDRDAAFMSREVTLDFARSGVYGKVVNNYTPFFNASLQGLDKEVRQLKQNPLRFALNHLSYVVLPVFMASLAEQNMIQSAPNSEGAQKALETPEWQKAMFIHLYTGQDYKYQIALPTLHGMKAMMAYSVRKFVEFAHQKMGAQWLPEYMRGMGIVAGNQMVDVFPPVLKVPYESMSNYNMFTGNKIVSSHMANLMPELQYRPGTTMPARKLASFFEKAADGLGLPIPTQLQSPVHIEQMVQGVTGTLGMNMMRILDSQMRDQTKEPTKHWTELPMVKSFFVRYPTYGAKSIETFNREAQELQVQYNSIRELERRGRPEDKLRAMELVADGSYANLNKFRTAMSNWSKIITGIYYNQTMTPDEKRQGIDDAMVQLIRTARTGNEYIKSIKEKANAGRQ